MANLVGRHNRCCEMPPRRHASETEATSYGRMATIGKPTVDEDERLAMMSQVVHRLALETGITTAQASELVAFLGADWPSLVREARLIPKPGWLPGRDGNQGF